MKTLQAAIVAIAISFIACNASAHIPAECLAQHDKALSEKVEGLRKALVAKNDEFAKDRFNPTLASEFNKLNKRLAVDGIVLIRNLYSIIRCANK